jgi:hypothetical protein
VTAGIGRKRRRDHQSDAGKSNVSQVPSLRCLIAVFYRQDMPASIEPQKPQRVGTPAWACDLAS